MPSINLVQASLTDVRSLASLGHVAFGDDPMSHYMYHTPPQGSLERKAYDTYHLARWQSTFYRTLCNPRLHTIVSQTEGGLIVGAAMWSFTEETPSRRLTAREFITHLFYRVYDRVASFVPEWLCSIGRSEEQAAVMARRKRMRQTVASWDEKFIPEEIRKEGYHYLSFMGVMPSVRRQGIAARLLRWGCERADKEGKAIYLCSRNAGAIELYNKHGFKIIGKGEIGEAEEKYAPVKEVAMLRLPEIKEGVQLLI